MEPNLTGLHVQLVGVRGTLERFDLQHAGMGPTLAHLARLLARPLDDVGASLVQIGVPYPARPWRYRRNRQRGATALGRLLGDPSLGGASTRIVVAGLSQGADVVRHTLATAEFDGEADGRIAAVILLGDPGRCPGEPFQRGTADAAPGILASSAMRLPDNWHTRTWSYCLAGDEICANRRGALGLLRSGTHTHYAHDRDAVLTDAARFAFAQIERSMA